MKGDTLRLLRRVGLEKRRVVLPLGLVLLANLGVYAFVVYPLAMRVANADARAVAAETALRAAERERAAARATASGKQAADVELRKFYADVLPASFAAARRVLYLRVSQVARQANLQYKRQAFEEQRESDKRQSDLQKLTTSVVLEGSYENVRKFIYQLETGSDFVVIENVSLAMRGEGASPLVITVTLATYYRAGANGT